MVKVTFKDAENGQKHSSTAYAVVGGKFHLVGMKSADYDITLLITEDGKTIHTEPLKGKGVLQSTRKKPPGE